MRQKCDVCGEYLLCDDDGVCGGCRQDEVDLEDVQKEELVDWLPEDGYDDSDEDEED
jgi:hypothetical protein